ncbi:hypothetical protein X975_24709, partial [Stegodyphus mimosarum]
MYIYSFIVLIICGNVLTFVSTELADTQNSTCSNLTCEDCLNSSQNVFCYELIEASCCPEDSAVNKTCWKEKHDCNSPYNSTITSPE